MRGRVGVLQRDARGCAKGEQGCNEGMVTTAADSGAMLLIFALRGCEPASHQP